ncbi:phosphotransferase family protein [Salmonella enterica]
MPLNHLAQKGYISPRLIGLDIPRQQLLLEYIPLPVSQDELGSSDTIVNLLSIIHKHLPAAHYHFKSHCWREDRLAEVYHLLDFSNQQIAIFEKLRTTSDILFAPSCIISGDSNAGNWGRRSNGEAVLFDWERFGQGSPAIDLAPLIKGMGTTRDYIQLAERYTQINKHYTIKQLSREIMLSKAWIVTEVVTLLTARNNRHLCAYIAWYKAHLPDWLSHIHQLI